MDKSFGLPALIDRSKKRTLNNIVNNIRKKILWVGKSFLSLTWRKILLKSVVTTITNYTMQCFKLYKEFCNVIESIMTSYWWGIIDKKFKIHWVSWNTMKRNKKDGRLGFKDINHLLIFKKIIGFHILTYLSPSQLATGRLFMYKT